jgi:hypothetical protein
VQNPIAALPLPGAHQCADLCSQACVCVHCPCDSTLACPPSLPLLSFDSHTCEDVRQAMSSMQTGQQSVVVLLPLGLPVVPLV